MKDLLDLQNDFQNYLLTGVADIEHSVVDLRSASPHTRLTIYRNAYRYRLIEALADNFPALNNYLGHDAFHELALGYLQAHPSTFRSIRWFGSELSTYLQSAAEIHGVREFLVELAAFEWAVTVTFDAADAPVFQLPQMASIPAHAWGDMRFTMHPAVQLLYCWWNVASLCEATGNAMTLEKPIKNPDAVAWVLWRHDNVTRFHSLPADEAFALDAALQGQSFGDICEGLCKWHAEEEVGLKAASILKGWIETKFLSDILF